MVNYGYSYAGNSRIITDNDRNFKNAEDLLILFFRWPTWLVCYDLCCDTEIRDNPSSFTAKLRQPM